MSYPHSNCCIALDVMGGDHGPKVTLSGAAMALGALGNLSIILVGDQSEIERLSRQCGIKAGLQGRTKIVHAASVVAMDDKATSILKEKKDSSVRLAAECVRTGEAQGVVSMGHTGAAMVASMKVIGTLPGVDRPCLAAVFPSPKGTPTVLLDVGAVVDCKPGQIAQFALMGGAYAEEVLGLPNPKIGVLSVGEEEGKGCENTRQASAILKALGINFCGNAEGGDIWNGDFDVIACDGFIGNVVLKSSESLAESIIHGLRGSVGSGLFNSIGALFLRTHMRRFYKKFDYAEYGGAPLLGVKGISIIGHGRSNERAVANAIRAAVRGAGNNLNGLIQKRMDDLLLLHNGMATG